MAITPQNLMKPETLIPTLHFRQMKYTGLKQVQGPTSKNIYKPAI